MLYLGNGNGSGTKLFQSYFDGHPQILMTPGYILMYLYPHWDQWRTELADNWTWQAIVDAFCIKHASLLDTRRFPTRDGLRSLGKNQDQYLSIDETTFRDFLAHILHDQPITSRTFVLAVHYAYAFTRGEDLSRKKVLFYHLHVHEYVHYLVRDFPDTLAISAVRDPRSNIKSRFLSNVRLDEEVLNGTDAAVYLRRTFITYWHFHIDSLERLDAIEPQNVCTYRHEDMHNHLKKLMSASAEFMDIDVHPSMFQLTFGGLEWRGDSHYQMAPMNKANPGIVSSKWKNELGRIDWFVLEGLGFNYCNKYGYELYYYKKDGVLDRIKLFCALFVPFGFETWIMRRYLNPIYFLSFLKLCVAEATGSIALMDYGFNAAYRHKWDRQGLNLHIPPWYRRFLLFARNGFPDVDPAKPIPLLYSVAICTYVVANIGRYLFSLTVVPLLVFKRSLISIRPFLKMMRKLDVLPRPLV